MRTSVLGIWAILSILWATLYVALFVLVRQDIPFVQVVSDILTPITALLIIGGTVSKVFQGIQKLGSSPKAF